MGRFARAVLVLVPLVLAAAGAHAAAPSGKGVMQPIDTSPGSFSDPKKVFKVDLDTATVRVSVTSMPLELAFSQINATTGIEFGYGAGVTPQIPVTLSASGKGREVLKSLGAAAGIRFEANGPMHLRVVRARERAPLRTTPPRSKNP